MPVLTRRAPLVSWTVRDPIVADEAARDGAVAAGIRDFGGAVDDVCPLVPEPGGVLVLGEDRARRLTMPFPESQLQAALLDLHRDARRDDLLAALRRADWGGRGGPVAALERARGDLFDPIETAAEIRVEPPAPIMARIRRALAVRGQVRADATDREILVIASGAGVELSARDRHRLMIAIWRDLGAPWPRNPARVRRESFEPPVDRAAVAEEIRGELAARAQPDDAILIGSKHDMVVGYWGYDPAWVGKDDYALEWDEDERYTVDDDGVWVEVDLSRTSSYIYRLEYPFTGGAFRALRLDACATVEEEAELARRVDDLADDLVDQDGEPVHTVEALMRIGARGPLPVACEFVGEIRVPAQVLVRARRYLQARGIPVEPPWDRVRDVMWAAHRMHMPLPPYHEQLLWRAIVEAVSWRLPAQSCDIGPAAMWESIPSGGRTGRASPRHGRAARLPGHRDVRGARP